ncbi:YigZ family protein [Sporosalibacterium faouarense]|uniref:YigZ family protein n=1 Tax=Sporosalibacterium faouarense TaxID=516123 RepID=UPI00141C32BB|nr:YigZ family protein [Sporosalibacterium faouarense]MTI49104.1 YigZ family protein [Bacillota bacterium]
MKDVYRTVHEFGNDEVTINKSRFIGYAKPISSEEDAKEFIEEISNKHKDATHNVYAYVYGENSNIQRYSDDGEPSGTAGVPVLEVMKKEDLRNTVVVVTRYFGGIKLGGGGLIRAYTKGAKIGIDSAKIVDKTLFKKVKLRADYTLYGKIENQLMKHNYEVENIVYDDAVNIIILCQFDRVASLRSMLIELTSDTGEIEDVGEVYYSVLNGERLKEKQE